VLIAGMRLARRLLESKPLAPYYDHEDFPGDQVQSDDEFLGAAKQRGTTTFHPSGTCRMGPASDPMAVVDDELKVRGLEGLRVIDASIMPEVPRANTHLSVVMIAEKLADELRG
jgi:choline dehydrogenase